MATDAREDALKAAKVPRFQHYERFPGEIDKLLLDGGVVRRFTERAADLAGGASTIMELTMDDSLRRDNRDDADLPDADDRPLLTVQQLWNLQRLAVVALEQIQGEAERVMEWANEHGTPRAQRTGEAA